MTDAHNHNPTGKNQYGVKPSANDPALKAALIKYHKQKLAANETISDLLMAEHGIDLSPATVKRRRQELGLTGSGKTTKNMPLAEKTELVLVAMGKDECRQMGVQSIQRRIALDNSVHLTRDFVSEIMHIFDADGFKLREPTAKRIRRFPKHPLGVHERWSGDGHDKLNKIGFQIWAAVDEGSSSWLEGFVMPNNRKGNCVLYCFLCLVEIYGGIPLQMATDCGSETTEIYGMMHALRTAFYPEYDVGELPPHIYLRSVHNTSIERSWRAFRVGMGDNAVVAFMEGVTDGIYNDQDPQQVELCKWLWAKVLRAEMKKFIEFQNAFRMRKDKKKPGPSGMSRNEAFALPEKWGGRNLLLPIPLEVVTALKEHVGGPALIAFSSEEYDAAAQEVYDRLEITDLSLQTAWHVFQTMYDAMYL